MRRTWSGYLVGTAVVLSVACASAGPRRPAKKPPTKTATPAAPVSATATCKSVPADLDKQIATATAARDADYAKALAARKLTAWTGKVQITSRSEDPDDAMDARPAPPGPPAPKGVEIPLGSGVAYDPPKVELVADAAGTVYLVQREPTGTGPYYVRCGCGPVGGGARARIVRYSAQLPAGTKYGGPVKITYTDLVPRVGWDNMTNGQYCQPPP